jgi:tetratricopeptide (TPR) repeat protein
VEPVPAQGPDRPESDPVGRWPLWTWIVYAAISLWFLRRTGSDAGWFSITLGFSWFFYVALTLPHELGHALFSRLAGLEVFEVSVGFGRIAWAKRWRGVLFAVRGAGLGGFVVSAGPQTNHQGLRHAFSAFGGPAVNFALLLAHLPLVVLLGAPDDASLLGAAANGFFWANLATLASTSIPYRYVGDDGSPVWNDGLLVWSSLRADAATEQRWREGYYRLAADRAEEEGGAAAQREAAERGLAVFPDSFPLRYALGCACMQLHRLERARGIFRDLLADPALSSDAQVMLKNNIAYADLLLGDDLDEADRFSAEVAAVEPPVPYFLGTRGAALLRSGRHEEAISFLERAYALHELPVNRAIAAALLGIALERLGRREAAVEQVALAVSLGAERPEVRLARAIVGEPAVGGTLRSRAAQAT